MRPNFSESFSDAAGRSGGIGRGRKRERNREGEMKNPNLSGRETKKNPNGRPEEMRSGNPGVFRPTKKNPNGRLSGGSFAGGSYPVRRSDIYYLLMKSSQGMRSGNRGVIRPTIPSSSPDSFSREVSMVEESQGALYRRPQCLLNCWIDTYVFDWDLEGEVTYMTPIVTNAPEDYMNHMQRLASLALEAHHDYYSDEEKYMFVSLEKVVHKKSIDEYYITFTARQASDDAVKTFRAIIVNYCGVFDFVLYVKIISPDKTCCCST